MMKTMFFIDIFNNWKIFFQFVLLICSIDLIKCSNSSIVDQYFQVDIDEDVLMSCYFDPDSIEQVSFMRQTTGDILSVGSELFLDQSSSSLLNEHFQLKQISGNRLDLKIRSVQENDSGLYTCMINQQKLFSFHLEVFVRPRFVFYSPLEGTISLIENNSIDFFCDVYSRPSVNLTWKFTNLNKMSKNLSNGKNLSLHSVEICHSGLYECIASNAYHTSISRAFYLNVQYLPRISILNEKFLYSLNDDVQLICRLCSNPNLIHFQWIRNEQKIIDENIFIEKRIVDHQCLDLILHISNLNENQFGLYQCRGENLLGEKSQTISIDQMMRVRQLKANLTSPEINRNGRTINHFNDKSQINIHNRTNLFSKSQSIVSSTSTMKISNIFIVFFWSIFIFVD